MFLLTQTGTAITLDWETVKRIADKQSPEAIRMHRDFRLAMINSTLDRRTYLPKISADAMLPNQSESITQQLVSTSDTTFEYRWVKNKEVRESYSLSLSQEIPFGPQFSAYGNEYHRKYSVANGNDVTDYGVYYMTDLRWSLLSGNPTGRAFRIAGLQEQQAIDQNAIREREFELSLLSEFIQLINSQRQLALTKTDAALADSSLALAQRKFKAGVIAQTEMLTIELSALERGSAARSAERAFSASKDNFLDKLGFTPSTPLEFPDDPKLPQPDTTKGQVIVEHLPEVRIAKNSYEAAKLSARADLFPLPLKLDAHVYQNWNGYGSDQSIARNTLSVSKGGSLDLTLTLLDRNEFMLRQERRKLNLREADIALSEAMRKAERTLREAERALIDARERLVTAEKSLQIATLRATMTESRFVTGTLSSRDLLDAQQDKLRSEQSWVAARGEWVIAALRIQRLREQSE